MWVAVAFYILILCAFDFDVIRKWRVLDWLAKKTCPSLGKGSPNTGRGFVGGTYTNQTTSRKLTSTTTDCSLTSSNKSLKSSLLQSAARRVQHQNSHSLLVNKGNIRYINEFLIAHYLSWSIWKSLLNQWVRVAQNVFTNQWAKEM